MLRHFVALLAVVGAGCHPLHTDDRPPTPIEVCLNCCGQALDACKLDTDEFPMARCPPKYQDCTAACNKGDENEMCVIQTNRQFAAMARKRAASAPPTEPIRRGACDNDGTWKLTVAAAHGEAGGCVGLDSIPKQVSFRIERRQSDYAVRDLAPVPGWHDAFSIDDEANRCVVTLRRDDTRDAQRPRALEVRLTEQRGAVDGTLRYAESGASSTCALESSVAGTVIPRPEPPPPPRQQEQPQAQPQQEPPRALPPPVIPPSAVTPK